MCFEDTSDRISRWVRSQGVRKTEKLVMMPRFGAEQLEGWSHEQTARYVTQKFRRGD